MDWSRTKTIFIVTFFILDLFLGYQLYQKQSENKFEYMSESSVKIEDQLAKSNITYEELPEAPKALSHVIGETYVFSTEDVDNLISDDASIKISEDDIRLHVTFEEPRATIEAETESKSLLSYHALFHEDYVFAEHLSDKNNSLVYIQTYDGRPIYQKEDSANGQITVHLDENNDITGFSQTYLVTTEEGKEQEILSAIKAINQLFNNNKLKDDDKITQIELGYYSLIKGKVQVLAPTWFIEVNGERHYYVNAINGLIDDPNAELIQEIGEGDDER